MTLTPTSDPVRFALDESRRDDCFLCRPASRLLAHVGDACYTLAGLGPLSDGYAVVATDHHGLLEGPHDSALLTSWGQYSEWVQRALEAEFGTCVLSEHGKMSICNPNRPANSHCYHPHFLLFPGAPDPLPVFRDHFPCEGEFFSSLTDALRHASVLSNYLLGSPRPGEYFVFPAPDGLPRQFARAIIADSLGVPDLASWQSRPCGDWAMRNAEVLRRILNRQDQVKRSR